MFQNKSAREQGIDTTRKFKAIDDNENVSIGDILELSMDDDSEYPFFNNLTTGKNSFSCYWYRLEYADDERSEITWDNIKEGDFVEVEIPNDENQKRMVLSVHGKIIDVSKSSDFESYGFSFSKQDFIKAGFHIVQPGKKVYTMEEVAKALKVDVKDLKIKK
jgi:hypothetical protein